MKQNGIAPSSRRGVSRLVLSAAVNLTARTRLARLTASGKTIVGSHLVHNGNQIAVVALFESFQRWCTAIGGSGNDNALGAETSRLLNFLAQRLRDKGSSIWQSTPNRIVEAVGKVEQSWGLKRDPDTAVLLGDLYDLTNRHQDMLSLYREAFHLFPRHARLRYEAGTMLFRHGQPQDIRDFVDAVQEIDPDDIFTKFAATMLAKYPAWVTSLAATIERQSQGATVYTLTCPLWGKSFEKDFTRYLCAALLAPNNLPALAKRYPVVLAIFTTAEIEERLKAEPMFQRVAQYATVHFTHYDPALVDYSRPMVEQYGATLGPYYARTCKFLLFSCAHYAALAAGHDHDCIVVPLCSDSILSDGVLSGVADIMLGDVDIISFWGFRIVSREAREGVERDFRAEDGSLAIPARSLARLFVDYAPDAYCVNSKSFSSFPENLYWRVGSEALLVHASHYHPICIRPSALSLPLALTIDPVDSRFLDKHFSRKERLHFIRDLSMASVNLEDEAVASVQQPEPRTMSPREVGRWLWQVWSPWRATNFEAPICISTGPLPPEWATVRRQAQETTREIIEVASEFEDGNRRRKSWRVRGQTSN